MEGGELAGGDCWEGVLSKRPAIAVVDRRAQKRRQREGCGVVSTARCSLSPSTLLWSRARRDPSESASAKAWEEQTCCWPMYTELAGNFILQTLIGVEYYMQYKCTIVYYVS